VIVAETHLDERTERYAREVAAAIDSVASVREAFALGSAAVGGFDPETSDLDLVVVVGEPLRESQQELLTKLRQLAAPVRDLELVVYVEGAQPPDFELNVNEGEERLDAEPFWFVLDAALAQEHAVPLLHGRAWNEFFEPVSPERTREAMQASLDWTGRQPAENDFARAHAARAQHYLERGEWISKKEAQA
jgi:predicted nucleotidyltransferase